MSRLYYEDLYLKEFKANIIDIKEIDNSSHVVLDKTAFFQGGGGQFCDIGTIGDNNVESVYEQDGVIYHIISGIIKNKENVVCKIDWDHREDGMHQHLAQHVLSGCFYTLFNQNTVGFHLGNEISTVDIAGEVDDQKIKKVEEFANEIIRQNLEVRSFVPTKQELHKFKLRRILPKTNKEIRVVKIGDLDINACCGVHPNNTLELRIIKIKRHEKYKGNTRIEFIAGSRAVNDTLREKAILKELSRYLNIKDNEIINRIQNITNDIKMLNEENKRIKEEISAYEIKDMLALGENINNIKVINKTFINENNKYVNKIVTKLVQNDDIIALMAIKSVDKINLIFGCSRNIKNISMSELLKDSITLIDGKGGGSLFLAQGAGKNNNNLDSCISYAINKIKREC